MKSKKVIPMNPLKSVSSSIHIRFVGFNHCFHNFSVCKLTVKGSHRFIFLFYYFLSLLLYGFLLRSVKRVIRLDCFYLRTKHQRLFLYLIVTL